MRDCFPTNMMERARHLSSYGAHLRRTEENVRRYRVINKSGEPLLQVASGNGRNVDQEVDEEALGELIAGQAESRAQRSLNTGKTGPRHVAKNKKAPLGKKTSGRSSPMVTDTEDNHHGLDIPATSSNAVPQGPQRMTTNLASGNVRARPHAQLPQRQPQLPQRPQHQHQPQPLSLIHI